MIDVPTDLRCEISGLQWLDLQQLKSRYADILQDGQKCERIELLRSVIAYRLQERFYGERLGKSMMELLNNAVQGESLAHSPADRKQGAVKRYVRNWRGKDYEVIVYADDKVEYEGKRYKSLTAVAKAITGTHWNGLVFFGVKK